MKKKLLVRIHVLAVALSPLFTGVAHAGRGFP